jgi:hypothetical protein
MHESTMVFRKNLLTPTANSQIALHTSNKVLRTHPRRLQILCYPNPELFTKNRSNGGRLSQAVVAAVSGYPISGSMRPGRRARGTTIAPSPTPNSKKAGDNPAFVQFVWDAFPSRSAPP